MRFPPLDVDIATNDIIKAITAGKAFATIPADLNRSVKYVNLFPLSVQQLARDLILREFEFKDLKKA